MTQQKRLLTARIESDYYTYLTDTRVNKTEFVRQAIQAHKDGKFKYIHKDKRGS